MPGRRLLLALLTILLVIGGVTAAGSLAAPATPPSSEPVDVPLQPGQTIVREWTGTVPASTLGTGSSSCAGRGDEEVSRHAIRFNVPPGAGEQIEFEAKFTIKLDAQGPLDDHVLTVVNKDVQPTGGDSAEGTEGGDSGEVGSSDGGSDTEEVAGVDLPTGNYEAQACAFTNNPAGSPYTGRLVVTTKPVAPPLPAADARGLTFSASVPADPQRDEGEPIIEIDDDGNLYTCGPTGVSNAAEYAQVSTDDGDQFHLLGEPPRGQISPGGGGDCSLATAPVRNAQQKFNLAYTGLGPLTNFAASRSADNGRTFEGSPANGATIPGVDRQWQTFLDANTVLLSYNQQAPRQVVVQKSTDGGLTYGPRVPATATNPSFPGPMRSMPNPESPTGPRLAYFSWNAGTDINLAVTFDGGTTWKNCKVATAPGEPTLFTTSDNDTAGNIYVAYGENAQFHTYLATLKAADVKNCDQGTDKFPDKNPGFGTPVQVDRAGVNSSLFSWVTAGGAPGQVAVGFYGTPSNGNPNLGTFKASWNVYVNQSTNALDPGATFSQVQATTHPIHYDSICLNGLGCSVSGGDRSLADFFAVDYSPKSKRIHVVYDTAYKAPGEAEGTVATPTVVSQIAGPSIGGGSVDKSKYPDTLRDSSEDPVKDAISDYSTLNSPRSSANQPAGDLESVAVDPDGKGGIVVSMKLTDISNASLQSALGATQANRLLWIFRWFNGHKSAAAVAKYTPAGGFTLGFNDFVTGSVQCGGTGAKCLQYPGDQAITGKVDQKNGTISMTVPKAKLKALAGPQGPDQRPAQVAAGLSDRLYDGTAFSLADISPAGAQDQSFLYPLDNAPAMDFIVGGIAAAHGGPGGPGGSGGPGGGGGAGQFAAGCTATPLFRSASVARRGRGARLSFSRTGRGTTDVDVFQQSRGRRVVGERLVARFTKRTRSFTWNGRATSRRKKVTDGYYFVRFTTRGPGARTDVRRVTVRRSGGRFTGRPAFFRRATCDLLPSFKLTRPVFGGSGRSRSLGISYRVAAPSRVGVTVLRGSRVVRRFPARQVSPGRTIRLSLATRGLPRADYRVRLSAVAGSARLTTALVARRL